MLWWVHQCPSPWVQSRLLGQWERVVKHPPRVRDWIIIEAPSNTLQVPAIQGCMGKWACMWGQLWAQRGIFWVTLQKSWQRAPGFPDCVTSCQTCVDYFLIMRYFCRMKRCPGLINPASTWQSKRKTRSRPSRSRWVSHWSIIKLPGYWSLIGWE